MVWNEVAAEFETFALLTLEKYQQFSHMGPWSATLHFAKQIKKTLDKWKRLLFLQIIFKIFFIHVYERC